MAKEKDEAPSLDEQQRAFADQIAAGVSAGIVQATNKYGPVRQIPITQYRTKSKTNPLGLHESQRPQLTRRYFQNGFDVHADKLNDEQRRLLAKLQPGQYLGGLISISVRNPGNGESAIVDINYNNASVEQRIELKTLCRDFTEIVRACVSEHEALVGA
jgi:hypothetical protein